MAHPVPRDRHHEEGLKSYNPDPQSPQDRFGSGAIIMCGSRDK